MRDKLPFKLSTAIKRSQDKGSNIDLLENDGSEETKDDDNVRSGSFSNSGDDDSTSTSMLLSLSEASFIKSFNEMDDELRSDSRVDCFCSGTTAVSIVRLAGIIQMTDHFYFDRRMSEFELICSFIVVAILPG